MRSCYSDSSTDHQLEKNPHNDGHFLLLGRAHCCFLDDWCGNSIPKRKKIDLRLTDYLFVWLGLWKKWNFLAMSDAFSWPFVHPDGWHVDWLFPQSLLFGSREEKKNKTTGYTHSTQQQLTHTHHDEFRACASALNNKKKTSRNFHGLARLSCIYRSIHPCL